MTRFYAPYQIWEDFNAGMYRSKTDYTLALKCSLLLSDQCAFLDSAIKMVFEWEIASAVNLSNKSRNRQAWIGQATCCYIHGANENTTIAGWRMMDTQTQADANATADTVISYFEKLKGDNPCQSVLWA